MRRPSGEVVTPYYFAYEGNESACYEVYHLDRHINTDYHRYAPPNDDDDDDYTVDLVDDWNKLPATATVSSSKSKKVINVMNVNDYAT